MSASAIRFLPTAAKSNYKIDRIDFEQLCWPEEWRAWMPAVAKGAKTKDAPKLFYPD
jgi:hypothetical protein